MEFAKTRRVDVSVDPVVVFVVDFVVVFVVVVSNERTHSVRN